MTTRTRRHYTPEDEALFARYQAHREAARPLRCTHDPANCWVERGPPAMTPSAQCRGCGALPRAIKFALWPPPDERKEWPEP